MTFNCLYRLLVTAFLLSTTTTAAIGGDAERTVPRELAGILEKSWKLTSDDDSVSKSFQFEAEYSSMDAQGKIWIRRLVVERNGVDVGILLLSEKRLAWGKLLDDMFMLLDPDRPGEFQLVRGGHFKVHCALTPEGDPQCLFGTSTWVNATSTVNFDPGGLTSYLVNCGGKVEQKGRHIFSIRRDAALTGTLELAADPVRAKFPIHRISCVNDRGEGFHIQAIVVDAAPRISVLKLADNAHTLPKIDAHIVRLKPNSGPVRAVDSLIARLRDGNPELDATGEHLLKRCKTTDVEPAQPRSRD